MSRQPSNRTTMRIKNKLFLLALTPILGTTALVSVGYNQMGDLREANRYLAEDQFGSLVQNELPQLESLHKSIALLLNGDRDAYQVLQAELQIMDGAQGEALDGLIDQSAGNLVQVHERILKGGAALAPGSLGLVTEFEGQFEAWKTIHLANIAMASSDLDQALAHVPTSLAAFEEMRNTIDLMQEAQENEIKSALSAVQASREETEQTAAASSASAISTMRGFLILGLVIVAAAFVGSMGLARTILRPMSALVARFKDIAQGSGDLSQRVDETNKDELGEMGNAFNTFLSKLESLVQQIRNGTHEIRSNTSELTTTSDVLASSSAQQAEHLSNILDSATEVTEMTNNNAQTVQVAADLFERATASIDRGRIRMEEMVGAMEDITESSVEIAEISKTIDEFAFQTNLLALNGSVEAARAGAAGAGFAVVVEEVRNLSQRSAKASSEANNRVTEATARTERGAAMAEEVQELLAKVLQDTKETSDLMGEILSSTGAQSERIDYVNRAVQDLDLTVQNNASNAEQLAASALTTSDMVGQLDNQVSQFQTTTS